MKLEIPPEGAPLYLDAIGRAMIVGTRVPLDTIVESFKQGNSPEKIAYQYDTVSLPKVKTLLAFYQNHKDEVEEYLKWRREERAKLRAEIESQPEYVEWRKEMIERGRAKGFIK